VKRFIFVFFESFTVVGIVVGFIVIGIGIVESTAVSAAASPVKCVHGGGLGSEEAVDGMSSIVVCSVGWVFGIISIVVRGVVSSIINISSSASSEISTVDCVGGSCLRRAEGSPIFGFSVVLVFVVVGLVGIIVRDSIGKASSMLCTSSPVDCSSSCGS